MLLICGVYLYKAIRLTERYDQTSVNVIRGSKAAVYNYINFLHSKVWLSNIQ